MDERQYLLRLRPGTIYSYYRGENDWFDFRILAAPVEPAQPGTYYIQHELIEAVTDDTTLPAVALADVPVSFAFSQARDGQDGLDGLDGQNVFVQYSVDGVTGWEDPPFVAGQRYFRTRTATDEPWSVAALIVGENGIDGEFFDFIFRRSTTPPATPTGNNPAGWVDDPGAATGSGKLYFSRGRKTAQGNLIGAWSPPAQIEGADGIDGIDGLDGADAVREYFCGDAIILTEDEGPFAYSSTSFARITGSQLAGDGDVRLRFLLAGGNLVNGRIEVRQGGVPLVLDGGATFADIVSTTSATVRQFCVQLTPDSTDPVELYARIVGSGTQTISAVEFRSGYLGAETVV